MLDENDSQAQETEEIITSDQLDLLRAQLIVLINEPITTTTCDQITDLISQLQSALIDVDTANADGNKTNTTSKFDVLAEIVDYTGETSELTNAICDQIKEIVTQIVNLITQPITTSAEKEQINELISQLFSITTAESGSIVSKSDKSSNEESTDTEFQEDATKICSKDTTMQPIVAELPIQDCNTATSGDAGEKLIFAFSVFQL